MTFQYISYHFLLFIMYSCAGWIMETTWVSINRKKFVDRGFLIGPYCPIYGFGALLITTYLETFSFNPVVLFIMTVLVCGILEYLTSLIMEKVFKARWWDYSNKKFNLNGRICLQNLIAFGIMGLAVTYFINPYFTKWLALLYDYQIRRLAVVLGSIFLIDLTLSTIVVFGFRKVAEKVNKEGMADNTEQITKMVRELFAEKSFLHRRFINAYPKLEAIKIKMKEIKTKIEDVTNDAKDAVAEKTEEIRSSIEEGTRKARLTVYLGKKHIKAKFKGNIRRERE